MRKTINDIFLLGEDFYLFMIVVTIISCLTRSAGTFSWLFVDPSKICTILSPNGFTNGNMTVSQI